MCKSGSLASLSAITSIVILSCTISAAPVPGDLSRYRGFQFGTDLATVARQAGVSPSQATVTQTRPALIQELEWRPRGSGQFDPKESANEVHFRFYNGELYQIVVAYDRFELEGMTAADVVDAVSRTYGPAARVAVPVKAALNRYGDEEELIARWQDPKYCFDLIRSSHGPTFRLVGILKHLDTAAEAAIVEAKRLDDQEAPQRIAAHTANEEEAERIKLEKTRLVNKPRFRP